MCSNSASKLFQTEREQFQFLSERRNYVFANLLKFYAKGRGYGFLSGFPPFSLTVYSNRNPPQNSLVCDWLMLSSVHPYWLK